MDRPSLRTLRIAACQGLGESAATAGGPTGERSEFERLTAELRTADQRIVDLKQRDRRPVDPKGEVDAALRILEHLDQVVQHPAAREPLGKLGLSARNARRSQI